MTGGPDLDDTLDDAVYAQLLRFRRELRAFLRWSEQSARAEGLTPSLHQLLLAVRGSERPGGATVRDAAEALGVQHNSAVELAQRAEDLGLVVRARSGEDQREVRLTLTPTGADKLAALTRLHRPRIADLARVLGEVTDGTA